MDTTRLVDPDRAPRSAFVLAESHGPTRGRWHTHRRCQLVHAAEGVVTVTTPAGKYVAPPQRAVWVAGGVRHAVASRRPYRLLTLYADASVITLAAETRVLAVSPLVEQLLLAAADLGPEYPEVGPAARLVQVLLDRLQGLDVAPLSLPEPRSPSLARITDALTADPADRRPLPQLCKGSGMSPKTAARRFEVETGMTFGQWRKQLRLLAALERLGAGESVTTVALDVGYQDVSAFIAVFKRTLGTTPARYFR